MTSSSAYPGASLDQAHAWSLSEADLAALRLFIDAIG